MKLDKLLVGALESSHPAYDFHEDVSGGSMEVPTIVPSIFEERLVGCACGGNEDHVRWLILREGRVEVCGHCGNCYRLAVDKKQT